MPLTGLINIKILRNTEQFWGDFRSVDTSTCASCRMHNVSTEYNTYKFLYAMLYLQLWVCRMFASLTWARDHKKWSLLHLFTDRSPQQHYSSIISRTLLSKEVRASVSWPASAMNQDKEPAPPHTGASASGHLISSPHTLHILEQDAWRNQLNADTLHLHAKSYRIMKT